MEKGTFEITVQLAKDADKTSVQINHSDETFDFQLEGQSVSILNNGDNSWSLVKGNLDQERVNAVGEGIERYYKDQKL